jgi:4-hydroxy-3-polyprenylbenzoate decarboxylase
MARRISNSGNDLRVFIDQLDELGEVKTFKGADWNLEIGALTEIIADQNGPALLFDEIKDYPRGFRVLANVLQAQKRAALTLGLPSELSGVALLNAWRNKLRDFKPMPPKKVAYGPVLEHVIEGDAVDLAAFPTPLWHEKDGGRYIGTGDAVITRDPESGAVNLGTYRCMIQGKNRISIKMNKGKHGRLAMQKYHAMGKPCPVAVSLGHVPQLFMAALSPLPVGVDEYDFAGWLCDAPIEVIECADSGLPIPAFGEIVLEGEVPPYKDGEPPKEGPFGEWPGYYADTTVGEVPVMEVKRIYHRSDPIMLGAPPLKPPNNFLALPLGAAALWDQLEKAGIPEIRGVWGYVYGSQTGPFTVIAIRQAYAGHAKQALLVASGARAGAYGGKFVVAVDDDVDITNPSDVIWAVSTRCNAREGIDLVKNVWTSPADPAIPPNERSAKGYTSDRVLIDACRPYRWMDEFPEVNCFPPEIKERYRKKWNV